ncbi:UMP kinase [archaeon]|jgi:uridylate kinase|nr:UMP kinase [archaeon]
MKKEIIVLSLGGSLIIPEEVDYRYLEKLKKIVLKHTKKYKFIFVCGGGSIARKYIAALKKNKTNETLQSFAGIGTTRMNARFMSYFFNLDPKEGIPHTMELVEKRIKNHNIIFCGALEYKPNQTSDSTAALVAKHFKTKFINLTNVKGLYTKNPKKYKDAKFIEKISWKDFDNLAQKMTFKPGQHFVLDQTASKMIKKYNLPTFILGQDTKQLDNFLNNKKFIGTTIQG